MHGHTGERYTSYFILYTRTQRHTLYFIHGHSAILYTLYPDTRESEVSDAVSDPGIKYKVSGYKVKSIADTQRARSVMRCESQHFVGWLVMLYAHRHQHDTHETDVSNDIRALQFAVLTTVRRRSSAYAYYVQIHMLYTGSVVYTLYFILYVQIHMLYTGSVVHTAYYVQEIEAA